MRLPDFGRLFAGAYRGRRVLVTGHTGFKGSWLALWLQQLGARVSGLALPAQSTPNHHALLDLPLAEAFVDLRDAVAVHAALQRFEPEVVFHLAAQPLVRQGYREPTATFDTNVMGLVNLLEAVRATRSVRVVVNATTDKCYRNDERGVAFREGDALGGRDPYSASKACAELVSACWRSTFLDRDDGRGSPVALATARSGNVIGGGDWGDDRLVPDLARAATSGRPARVRQPHAVRPWQHVLEPLAGYLRLGQRLLESPQAASEAFNFGPAADGHLPVRELIDAFADAWPRVRVEQDDAPQPAEASCLRLDCAKAAERLQWRPVWNIDTSVRRSAWWYRAHHEHGLVDSRRDLQQYVSDARAQALTWAVS